MFALTSIGFICSCVASFIRATYEKFQMAQENCNVWMKIWFNLTASKKTSKVSYVSANSSSGEQIPSLASSARASLSPLTFFSQKKLATFYIYLQA